MKKAGERLFATIEPCIGIPLFHKLILKGENGKAGECVAWMLLRWYQNGSADMMMIYVEEKNRNKGYAKELLEYIKPMALEIRTDYESSTEAGRKTCIDAGFEKVERKDDKTEQVWQVLSWLNKEKPEIVFRRYESMLKTLYNKAEEDDKGKGKTAPFPKRITEKKE